MTALNVILALEAFHHTQRDNTDIEWMDQAECKNLDGNLFFPERGEDASQARRVCRSCPVQEQCLEYALENGETHGIWGGTSARERERLRAQRDNGKSRRWKPIRHGTEGGYSAHRRRDEDPCDECAQAHRTAHADYQRRRNRPSNDVA